jgi:hypothetical protein
MALFADRVEAGRELAAHLDEFAGRGDVLVLGLARGGVPVAAEVARAIGEPLDVLVVRKVGAPGHEELALGAVGSGGVLVLNDEVVLASGIGKQRLADLALRERRELERRERLYHREKSQLSSRAALSFSTSGRASSRIGSCSKSGGRPRGSRLLRGVVALAGKRTLAPDGKAVASLRGGRCLGATPEAAARASMPS